MVMRLSKQGSYQVLFRAHEASPRLANEVCDWKKAALIRLAGLTRTRPPNVSFGGHGALWGLSRGATPRSRSKERYATVAASGMSLSNPQAASRNRKLKNEDVQ